VDIALVSLVLLTTARAGWAGDEGEVGVCGRMKEAAGVRKG
jgi:hypothetical protein